MKRKDINIQIGRFMTTSGETVYFKQFYCPECHTENRIMHPKNPNYCSFCGSSLLDISQLDD